MLLNDVLIEIFLNNIIFMFAMECASKLRTNIVYLNLYVI